MREYQHENQPDEDLMQVFDAINNDNFDENIESLDRYLDNLSDKDREAFAVNLIQKEDNLFLAAYNKLSEINMDIMKEVFTHLTGKEPNISSLSELEKYCLNLDGNAGDRDKIVLALIDELAQHKYKALLPYKMAIRNTIAKYIESETVNEDFEIANKVIDTLCKQNTL